MDPLKTVFIDSIPIERDDAMISALKPLGLTKWVRVASDCGFAQFNSAAQIKAALEVLPMASLTVNVSDRTKTWVYRAANKATVQNVTRMSPTYLANKIRITLDKDRGKPSESSEVSETTQHISPDGTLDTDDPKLKDEIYRFREQSLAPKKKDTGANGSRDPVAKKAHLTPQSNVDEKIGSRIVARALSSSASPVMGDSGPPLTIVSPEPEDRAQLPKPEASTLHTENHTHSKMSEPHTLGESPSKSLSHSPEPPLHRQQDLDSDTMSSSQLLIKGSDTPLDNVDLKTILAPLIEEFFGVPDEDVIKAVETHIKENREEEQLSAEFRDILEDDFMRFAEKVKALKR